MKQILLGAAMALGSLAAQAGSVQITVTDKDGKPTPDVVVLVETPGRPVPANVGVTATIAQEDLKFQPFLTVVPAGSTLRFVNRDGYDHHVRSMPSGPLGSTPPAQSIELRLDASAPAPRSADDDYQNKPPPVRKKSGTSSVDVKVDKAGPIGLGCHLHSSMRGQVYVSATPWFAKTDANGVARLENVPDGAIELSLWHPDQLQEQPIQRVQATAAPLTLTGQLNFVPRRRRS
ncbi:plastocyanin [Piscinibacter sp.]|jgi:plastocyanin|uniref:plastocyanin n=1 Tax=Piscinibacter sp. TaxID=1903157 RepID=UPI001D8400B9|nr:plastocyanin [Piscinibacter sp.]MBK7529377.1 plastocyanin [Piscinibacter sp.]MBL0092309.1 plastocyanin [Piscinibacter sp.]HNW63077.1 plastocyanin [Piscinibacter sp.]HOY34390.1 plastocyanin [Piscinibacter sp.]HPG79829.1 plastocyanin [Piscinibacter sp.]